MRTMGKIIWNQLLYIHYTYSIHNMYLRVTVYTNTLLPQLHLKKGQATVKPKGQFIDTTTTTKFMLALYIINSELSLFWEGFDIDIKKGWLMFTMKT